MADLNSDAQKQLLDILISENLAPSAKLSEITSFLDSEGDTSDHPGEQIENIIYAVLFAEATSYTHDLMVAVGNLARQSPGRPPKTGDEYYEDLSAQHDVPIEFIKKMKSLERNPLQEAKDDFASWSHSMCHAFERYSPSFKNLHASEDKEIDSLLDVPELHDGAKIILEEAVHRALKTQNLGNLDRMLGAVVTYNLSAIGHNGLCDEFAFRPQSAQQSAELIEFFDHDEYYQMTVAFLEAQTPAEFLQKMIAQNIPINAHDTLGLYSLLKPVLSEIFDEATLNSYLEQSGMMPKNISASPPSLSQIYNEDCERGFYFDVDDTLISHGKLVEDIAALALTLRRQGEKVTIITGDDPSVKNDQLTKLGFTDANVQSKGQFKGKTLETLIDDTPPSMQGFSALFHHLPTNLTEQLSSGKDINIGGVTITHQTFYKNRNDLLTTTQSAPSCAFPDRSLE